MRPLTALAREDEMRRELSGRVENRLRPILSLLDEPFTTDSLRVRFQEIRRRLKQAVSVIGGPSMSTAAEFQAALNEWVENQTSGGLHLVWQKIGPWPEWNNQNYHDALLILCEACSNARKHGHATEVKVLVHGWEEGFSITVEDNGEGFPGSLSPESQNGAGMGTMELRARRFPAHFFMMNREPAGTGAVVGWSKKSGQVDQVSAAQTPPIDFGKRLGMELHDHLCQHLVALMVEMELLREVLPEDATADWILMQNAEERLRTAHQEVREWSHHLIETSQLADFTGDA